MKIIPKAVDQDINCPKGTPVRSFFSYLIGATIVSIAALIALSFVIDLVLPFVPFNAERKAFSGTVLMNGLQNNTTEGKQLTRYISSLYERVDPRHTRTGGLAPRFHIIDSDAPNAFAFPGLHIAFTSGLLKRIHSEDELIFVLGHELGHLHNRDALRSVGQGVLFSIVLHSIFGADLVAGPIPQGARLFQLSYSRKQEVEADKIALQLLKKETGNSRGALRFFRVLQRYMDTEKHPELQQPEFFSTHPNTDSRIRRIEEAGTNRNKTLRPLPPDILAAIKKL